MNLELFPNEILLDIFDYFDGTNLLHAFYGLNSRFNLLLYKQFRFFRFRFHYISKRQFDLICQQHLPYITDQIIALELINDNETPNQIDLFCSYIRSFGQFTHLRTLTLSHLRSYEILLKIVNECQHLSHLTDLIFRFCSFSNPSADGQLIINKIWSLPKLTHCHFGIDMKEKMDFCVPTIISLSLTDVSISGSIFRWSQIDRLFDYTPHLKYFSVCIESSVHDFHIFSLLPTITKLNLRCYDKSITLQINAICQSMPNLRHLDVDIWSILIDGHQWEEIIRNYLPKLKTFRLKMLEVLYSTENIQEQMKELVNSFRSSFWIDERQWFVRCITWMCVIHLYTLSNESNYCSDWIPDFWQSTDPHDSQQQLYNQITRISGEEFFNQLTSSNICLPNINWLHMKSPINQQFWSIVSNLSQLNSLTISSHADTCQSQLQTLLDRAPHLTKLMIQQKNSLPLQRSLFQYRNKSIRQIDLRDYNHRFNEEECLLFSHSPLGIQCEVLSIQIQNRESIFHLVKNMLNLRSLCVYWDDEKYFERSKRANNHVHYQSESTQMVNEVVQWLKDHLPSTCLIVANLNDCHSILIWI